MLRIIRKRKVWFGISTALVAASIICMVVFGLNLGIDFTGGSLTEIKFENQRPEKDQIEVFFEERGVESVAVQPSGDDTFVVRSGQIEEGLHQEILGELKQVFPDASEQRFDSIGPTIGQELKDKAIIAIILVLVAIVAYIAYAFRKVSEPVASWKYGVVAIITLFHDVIIVSGVYVVMGQLYGYEINSLFVTALLTTLGYSVNDTIVTFDRVRDNLVSQSDESFPALVNTSVNQTIVRSLNTGVTTFLVLLAIFLFGGETIAPFVFALMVGVIVGTFSSIFLASPLLVWLYKRQR